MSQGDSAGTRWGLRRRGERLGLTRADRRGRVLTEILIGVGLVVGGAAAMTLWFRSATSSTEILVLARDMRRGEVVGPGDLSVAVVRGGEGARWTSTEDPVIPSLVGGTLVTDLDAGTPFHPRFVTRRPPLGPRDAIISVALRPGEFPAPLATTDVVEVMVVSTAGDFGDDPRVERIPAEVVGVDVPGEFDSHTVVTLRVPRDLVEGFAVAEEIRLAVVAS